jgi:cullin-associated NEDD8-dissociated protein 1
MSPEFNTIGDPLPTGPVSRTVAPEAQGTQDYKATVVLMFRGGADSFSFIAPLECDLFEEYKQARTGIAFQNDADWTKVDTAGQACSKFGIHASMPFVADLYNQGDAAFVSNIGSLVEPMTRTEYFNGNARKCNGLMSHKHQQASAQSVVCQTPGGNAKGVVGRIADALSGGSGQYKTAAFSLYGANILLQGAHTNYQAISPALGSVRFHYLDTLEEVLQNMTSEGHGNVFCEEYAQAILEQVTSANDLAEHLDPVQVATEYDTGSSLAEQLHQVARLIKTRDDRKAERDFFFVQSNQWDMHHNLLNDLPEALGIVDDAIRDFQEEMQDQGVWDKVVLVTNSDFGRTITSNGQGADHAWAGNHMVLGGAVNGGRIYNEYPSTLLEHNDNHTNMYDIGRGRLIPKYPWESMLVPVAEWLGVESSQLDTVFPNYGNFDRTRDIISSERGDPLF